MDGQTYPEKMQIARGGEPQGGSWGDGPAGKLTVQA